MSVRDRRAYEELHDEEEGENEVEYDENEDGDFQPDKVEDEDSVSSSDDGDGDVAAADETKSRKTGKRKQDSIEDELDSGDEATMKEQKRKKRRKGEANEEDSGGEAGFIKTRSQRLAEVVERKARKRAQVGEATIDVEKAWSQLSSIPLGRTQNDNQNQTSITQDETRNDEIMLEDQRTVIIKRRINFAGKIEEIQEEVLKDSDEAREYFAEHPDEDPDRQSKSEDANAVQRPMKRPSIFEPNPSSIVKGVPPDKLRPRAPNRVDVLMAAQRASKKAEKMSTVQKSALDWRGFVAQEGLNEELATYKKSSKGFLDREAFLDRAAATREQAARDARLKT